MYWNGIGCVVALLLFAEVTIGDEPRLISYAKSTIAIYWQDLGHTSTGDPKLIFCVWDDGKVVWSHDRSKGGAPYFEGKIEPELLKRNLEKLTTLGLLESKDAEKGGSVVVHGECKTILARHDGKELELCTSTDPIDLMLSLSAHEEEVITKKEKFTRILDKIDRETMPFQIAWLQLQAMTSELMPSTGSKAQGRVELENGELSWVNEKVK